MDKHLLTETGELLHHLRLLSLTYCIFSSEFFLSCNLLKRHSEFDSLIPLSD